jgi:hypothetical protein
MNAILPHLLAEIAAALAPDREPLSLQSALHLVVMEPTRKEKWDYIRHLEARHMITEVTYQQLVRWMKAK